MKILHVISSNKLDSHFFRGLLRDGKALGLEQDLWVLGMRGSLNAAFEAAGGESSNFVGSLAAAPFHLHAFTRATKPRIVHAHLYRSSLAAAAAKLLFPWGPPLLITRHHNDQHFLYGKRRHVIADATVSGIAKKVVAVSRQTAATIINREKTSANKVETIEVGLDLDRFVTRSVVAETSSSRPLLIAIGKPDMFKGFAVLLEAFRRVRVHFPTATLRIIGPAEGFLQREPGVEMSGWLEDVRPELNAADLFVHASFSEACCQVVLEAVACGVRTVTTNVGNAIDVVTPERGSVVPTHDVQALADAIIQELSRPAVIAPARFAGTEFDNHVMSVRYAKLYASILAAGRNDPSLPYTPH